MEIAPGLGTSSRQEKVRSVGHSRALRGMGGRNVGWPGLCGFWAAVLEARHSLWCSADIQEDARVLLLS